MIICDSIKLMLSISQSIKNKNNLFGKKLPVMLLTNIISFLPCKYITICRRICKTWFNNLNNNLSKNILQIPKEMRYIESFNLTFGTREMFRIKSDIYTSDYLQVSKINIKTKLIEKINKNKDIYLWATYSNNNYILVKDLGCVKIYSSDMKLINKILIGCWPEDSLIDSNNNILTLTNSKFYIHDLNGKLINSWDVIDGKYKQIRKISTNDKEIFIVDSIFNCVRVFSYEEKLVRIWGKYGTESGNFKNPSGIVIYFNIVFIVDTNNKRIQAFTCFGKFIFEHKYDKAKDIRRIIIKDNYVYISDYENSCITKFKLIYKLNRLI
jgi:hypothetical protein